MTVHAITVRVANAADAEAAARLSAQLGYPADARVVAERLERSLIDPDRAVVVADVAGVVAAWLEVQHRRALESGEWAEIVALVVDASHQRRGVGTALVQWAARWSRARGLDRLRVRMNARRADAALFYESHGFAKTKAQQVYDLSL